MNTLSVGPPVSGGLILSYRCPSRCKHCMYACSPEWKADWINVDKATQILIQIAGEIQASPWGPNKIGVNYGFHFTGGEPFLNFSLLHKVATIAHGLNIPSIFAETNCFWGRDDEIVREKLESLRDTGLNGILVSVNPFLLETVSFERTERVIRIGRSVFQGNVIVYQEFFYRQFEKLGIKSTVPFAEYLQKAGIDSLSHVELIPMGRACYNLGHLYEKYPAKVFFGESCREELTRPWHVHIDNYGNYMTGYCGGITLGDATSLNSVIHVNLSNKPILKALATDLKELLEIGVRLFDYRERREGYISKCHLCVDIRRHIAQRTDEFTELRPIEFYRALAKTE